MGDLTVIKKDIANYIDYLEKHCSLFISLHPIEYEEVIGTDELMRFITHSNSYCRYIKLHPEIWRHCVNKQRIVFEKVKNGLCSGTCHAGVTEYLYPIENAKKTVGFLCVSGYKAENFRSYVSAVSDKYELDWEEVFDKYVEALRPLPDKEEIDVLIKPLLHLITYAYASVSENAPERSKEMLYKQIRHFLNLNYAADVSLERLAKKLGYSMSYLSHVFKMYYPDGITGYVNTLRLNDAKKLLETTNINMTHIASLVGFSDSNYFTLIFRRTYGYPPKTYRNMIRSGKGE